MTRGFIYTSILFICKICYQQSSSIFSKKIFELDVSVWFFLFNNNKTKESEYSA